MPEDVEIQNAGRGLFSMFVYNFHILLCILHFWSCNLNFYLLIKFFLESLKVYDCPSTIIFTFTGGGR